MPTPQNLNMLNGNGFEFTIKKLPTVNFFVIKANVPGLSSNAPTIGSPFTVSNYAADHTDFENLRITFKVDENMENWNEIFKWLVGMTFPYSFDQRKKYMLDNKLGDALQSDGTLTVLTSAKNKNKVFRFQNLQPVSLSSIEFDTQNSDVDYVTCSVEFKYTLYELDI